MPENEVATEQINEPVVFTKAENPGLFEAICKELHISSKSTDFLSSEDLDKVIALDLEVKHGANVTSLNGIEKLRNLSSFEIYGMSDFNKAEIMYYDIYRASAKDFETAVFQYNQVEDFSPLQKCSKLEWCTIASQRKIKTLNVGGLHNLQTLWINSCEKLSNISGLATSMSNGELKKYGVENCEKLRKIENDNKFCELLKNRHDINVSFDSKYFINLMRDKPELRTTLEALPDESVKWAEHGQPYSTKQMLMVYDRIADIVNTVC